MKKILLSLALIALLGSGAVAATRAYFSDSAVLGSNTFTSGTINISASRGATDAPIQLDNMEPGVTYPLYLIVKNDGDFKIKWKGYLTNSNGGKLLGALRIKDIIMNPSNFTHNLGTEYIISMPKPDVSLFAQNNITDPISFSTLLNPDNGIIKWDSNDSTQKDPEPFAPKWAAVYRIDVMVDPTAGNEYMDKSWSGDLTIYATQEANPDWN